MSDEWLGRPTLCKESLEGGVWGVWSGVGGGIHVCPPLDAIGGWCKWSPSLDIPQLGSQWMWHSTGRPPIIPPAYGVEMAIVEAWPILTTLAASRGGQTWMPPPTPLHTPHALHSVGLHSHSSAAHRIRWNFFWCWDQDDTPSPLYFPRYFLSQPI